MSVLESLQGKKTVKGLHDDGSSKLYSDLHHNFITGEDEKSAYTVQNGQVVEEKGIFGSDKACRRFTVKAVGTEAQTTSEVNNGIKTETLVFKRI
jgi:hypothetical protein